jgi:hypothetical protein
MIFATMSDVGWRDGKLGGDLKQRCLGAWETKLALEEGGFGRVSVGVG